MMRSNGSSSEAGRLRLSVESSQSVTCAIFASSHQRSSSLIRLAPASPQEARAEEGTVFFVGNATVLIRYAGFTILTDPNFLHKGEHVHLGYGLRSERLTDPAIEMDRLPPIDLVLLSHYHEVHFDKEVERRLDRTIPIVTSNEAAEHLREHGFRSVHGLGKWQAIEIAKGDARLRITATCECRPSLTAAASVRRSAPCRAGLRPRM